MRDRLDAVTRRQAILAEAERLIGQCGYNGFGLQELATRCGMTKAGLLHHFPSKHDLLTSLLRERDAENESSAAALFGRRDPVPPHDRASARNRRSAIIAALTHIARRNAMRHELTRLHVTLRVEAINPEHPAHDYFQRRDAAKKAIISDSLTGVYPDPAMVARRILALMGGMEASWIREQCRFDMPGEFAAALELLLPEPAIADDTAPTTITGPTDLSKTMSLIEA